MNELPSAEFRKRYAKLTEETSVTVNGHPIGVWTPAFATHSVVEEVHTGPITKLPGGGVQARQAQRDDLLRKINRGK